MTMFNDAPQRRVAAAQDVLAMLQAGKIVAESTYVRAYRDGGILGSSTWDGVCSAIKEEGTVCRACIDGALMLSVLVSSGKFDQCSDVPGIVKQNDGTLSEKRVACGLLRGVFSRVQLDVMEAAFEQSWYDNMVLPKSNPDIQAALEWAYVITCARTDRTPYPTWRMQQICHNIIRNGGDFDPHDRTIQPEQPTEAKEAVTA